MRTAMSELTRIWEQASGSATEELPAGLVIWHCGCIPSVSEIDDSRALWTTRDASTAAGYEGFARESAQWAKHPAVKLELQLRRPLKAADFASASLLAFTREHCGSDHSRMKTALRSWMVEQGFGAVVRLNSDPTEVVISSPAADLVLQTATRL
jgi:hypothetical protein